MSEQIVDTSHLNLKVIPNYHWEQIEELPQKKEVSFSKETREWENCEYAKCEFGNFVVRGLEEDIDYLLNKFSCYFKYSEKEPVIDGIFDLKGFAGGSTIHDILNFVKEVPSVMIVGFFEDWYWAETVLFYSPSGYPYITDMESIGEFDPESEFNTPAYDIYPTQSMSAKFQHLQTCVDMKFNYDFAEYDCSADWDSFEFVVCCDDVYYILTESR